MVEGYNATVQSIAGVNMEFAKILKANPYHDERGRFTTRDLAAGNSPGTIDDVGGWDSWAGAMPKDLADSVYAYTTKKYARINDYLRKGKEDNEFSGDIANLDSVFKEATPITKEQMVYRGLGGSGEVSKMLKGLKEGDTLEDSAFVSTSLDKSVAYENFKDSSGVSVSIKLRPGVKAISLTSNRLTKFPEEKEVLLPRKSKFKVLKVTNDSLELEMI